VSRGVASVFGRFDALYERALSGGSGRGTEYAVLGQYGNPCTSWQENDADLVVKYIGPLSRVPSRIAYTL